MLYLSKNNKCGMTRLDFAIIYVRGYITFAGALGIIINFEIDFHRNWRKRILYNVGYILSTLVVKSFCMAH